jgi:hypothetical protein
MDDSLLLRTSMSPSSLQIVESNGRIQFIKGRHFLEYEHARICNVVIAQLSPAFTCTLPSWRTLPLSHSYFRPNHPQHPSKLSPFCPHFVAMAKNNDPYAMASQVSQQESRYTMTAPSNSHQSQGQNNQPHSSMPPPPHPDYQASSYTIPTSLFVPSSSPAAIPTQTPTDPLEQRILDLLYPYRDECFEDFAALTETKERNALILCGTLASPLAPSAR